MNQEKSETKGRKLGFEVKLFQEGWSELYRVLNVDQEDGKVDDSYGVSDIGTNELAIEQLNHLEQAAEENRSRIADEHLEIDYSSIQELFYFLGVSRVIEIGHGIDFDLELRLHERIFTENAYPNLFFLFVTIPGDDGFGLDKETHGHWGYHLHYVSTRKGRTNIAFSFNPKEPVSSSGTDKLYWFPHGRGKVKAKPGSFMERRREAIHSRSIKFLFKISKADFATPPKRKSKVLYP